MSHPSAGVTTVGVICASLSSRAFATKRGESAAAVPAAVRADSAFCPRFDPF